MFSTRCGQSALQKCVLLATETHFSAEKSRRELQAASPSHQGTGLHIPIFDMGSVGFWIPPGSGPWAASFYQERPEATFSVKEVFDGRVGSAEGSVQQSPEPVWLLLDRSRLSSSDIAGPLPCCRRCDLLGGARCRPLRRFEHAQRLRLDGDDALPFLGDCFGHCRPLLCSGQLLPQGFQKGFHGCLGGGCRDGFLGGNWRAVRGVRGCRSVHQSELN
jgi:hypothetical protein